ncbi:MAG: DUF45 domain-containing protein [Clostridia bacterium]|nr:DUF45 domain-containing protein [Clostridia bacterium]
MGILKFKNNLNSKNYLAVSVLGNSLKLNVKYLNISKIELNKTNTEINLLLPKKYKNIDNMEVINLSIQKLYDRIAETEIEYAMEVARHILRFAPEDYSIKRLENEFYKCSKNKIIVNPDIVRFSREVINTTIIQAFCKTKYRQNSENYKKLLLDAMNKYEIYNKKNYTNYKFVKVS